MRKAENGLLRPVIPDDSDEDEISIIKQHLQDAGFSQTDQKWLIDVFKRRDCFGDPNEVSTFRDGFMDDFEGLFPKIVEKLTEVVQIEKNRQTSLALLFSYMLKLGIVGHDPTWFLPNDELEEPNNTANVPEWVSKFQYHAKFCAESLDWRKLIEITEFDNLLSFLFPEGVPLDQVVNLDLLDPIQFQRQGCAKYAFGDPKELESWLKWRFLPLEPQVEWVLPKRRNRTKIPRGSSCTNAELRLTQKHRPDAKVHYEERSKIVKLDTLLQHFSDPDLPETVLGDKVLGLLNAIGYAMTIALGPGPSLNDGWQLVARELIPFLELLNEKQPELKQEPSSLLKAWWRLSKLIYDQSNGGLEFELSDELRNRLVESASRHIGVLRSVLRDTPEVFENEDVRDFYDKAFYVLLCFASPWKRLKPLLLAFTEMTEQAVARDLRTWREHDSKENPPPIYSRVPNWIEVAMYPQNLQDELERDPYLQELREEFAKFCLGRLRTKVKNKDSAYTDKDFIEPRPAWRLCYVQALAALRVNPGGRAHRTLFWLLNNDPDETVRELAKKAHKKVRHLDRKKPNLDEGASPRRPLFEAFWWLRQAHLMTLSVEIDRAGAMRTRRKELHRTREKDDHYR